MKRSFYFLSLLLITTVLAPSCKKDQVFKNPSQPTILQYIAQDPQLTLLNAAIHRSHLDTVFSGGGPFTFFCPVDSAFIAANLSLDSINRANPDLLSAFLRYHMIDGKISSNDIVGFLTENVNTLDSGFNVYVTKNYYGIFMNGAPVINGNIEAGDGVVQKIDALNPPPTRTVLQLIDSLPELSYMAAVVARIPALQSLFSTFPLFAPSLQYNPPGYYRGVPGFTVLAPTNAAFQTSLYPTLSAIQTANVNTLTTTFENYVINGFQFTSGFLGGWVMAQQYQNVGEFSANNSLTIGKDGLTIELTGYSDANPGMPMQIPQVLPKIINPNITASNGVIQEISEIF